MVMVSAINWLEEQYKIGELSLVEVEFARYLFRIEESAPPEVLIAGAACAHSQVNGHVCLHVPRLFDHPVFSVYFKKHRSVEELTKILTASKLVGNGSALSPLVLEGERLYLHKFWKYEEELVTWIGIKSKKTHALSETEKVYLKNVCVQDGTIPDWQKTAVILSLAKDFLIISGGPGTGKTHTAMSILFALANTASGALKVGLAAPTGKAAQRLNDSISPAILEIKNLNREGLIHISNPVTVHKLLGAGARASSFKYNERNKLSYDVLIVDEASMLDITLWIRLIRAIPDETKLILLGDKNQLASVEAGAILGDICGHNSNVYSDKITTVVENISGYKLNESRKEEGIHDNIVILQKSYRFSENSGIQQLADAINEGDHPSVITLLESEEFPEIQFKEWNKENFEELVNDYIISHYQKYEDKAGENIFNAFNESRILCALRKGPYGIEHVNEMAQQAIKKTRHIPFNQKWYSGKPIIITKNDAILKLKNGDMGICQLSEEGIFEVIFESRPEMKISPFRLQYYEPAFTLTVHKSQGSEYGKVAVLLPNIPHQLVTRELLYTAITRAKESVTIFGNKNSLIKSLQSVVARNSGLKEKLSNA